MPVPTVTPPPLPPATESPALLLEVVFLTSPITRGSEASLVAQTVPGALCSLEVTLPSGAVSGSSGTRATPVAGGDGTVSWTWRVGGSTRPGTGTVRVECALGGDWGTETASIVIQAKG